MLVGTGLILALTCFCFCFCRRERSKSCQFRVVLVSAIFRFSGPCLVGSCGDPEIPVLFLRERGGK